MYKTLPDLHWIVVVLSNLSRKTAVGRLLRSSKVQLVKRTVDKDGKVRVVARHGLNTRLAQVSYAMTKPPNPHLQMFHFAWLKGLPSWPQKLGVTIFKRTLRGPIAHRKIGRFYEIATKLSII